MATNEARLDENKSKGALVLISQHIFLFPFFLSPRESKSSTCLQEQPQCLFDGLIDNGWEAEPFEVFREPHPDSPSEEYHLNYDEYHLPYRHSFFTESCLNYDEYSYFHDYVRNALFNSYDYMEEKAEKTFSTDSAAVSTFFRYDLTAPSTFQIAIGQAQGVINYILDIKGITLRLFKTGVAILGIELHNYTYDKFEDIQRINDYGRRVYPQFMGDSSLKAPKGAFLANALTISIGSHKTIKETFEFQDFRMGSNQKHLTIGRHITELLGNSLCGGNYYIQPIIDDRMFTICCYANGKMIHDLTSTPGRQSARYSRRRGVLPTQSERGYGFETSDEWYRFVFIDGQDCTCQDDTLKRDLLSATTYRRWTKWGTLYGISRYSLMCLTTPSAPPFIREHMRRHYRQMAELLLAQRASMIVFSNRISELSGQIDDMNEKNNPNEFKNISKDVRKLHGDYIGFVNRLWFDEVTPQEQGIEMYDIAVKNMRLKEQMQELKTEIKELYEFVEMQDSNTMNKTALYLSKVASIGIPVALVLAFWGINQHN